MCLLSSSASRGVGATDARTLHAAAAVGAGGSDGMLPPLANCGVGGAACRVCVVMVAKVMFGYGHPRAGCSKWLLDMYGTDCQLSAISEFP